jgi:2-haloacid dehalogenase
MGRSSRDPRAARRWREQYLALTFSTGRYVPYESLVARAAAIEGLDSTLIQRLTQAYGQLRPWPEAPRVLATIAATMPIGTVTNCSDGLGHQAADPVGVPFEVMVTAQSAGAYISRSPSRTGGHSTCSRCRPNESCSWSGRHMTSPAPGRSAWMCGGTTGSACPPTRAHRPLAEHRSLDLPPAFVRGAGG